MTPLRLVLMTSGMLCLTLAPLRAQSAADHYRAGRAAMDSSKADNAVRSFELAVALDDRNADYHLWLGRALGTVAQAASVLRQPFLAKRVKSEFEKTVALDPSSIGAHEGLLQFYLRAPGVMGGSLAKAREQAELIAKYAPLRGHFARATVALYEKDQAAVEREHRAAAQEFPDSLSAVTTLANTLAIANRTDEAFATIDEYLRRKPGDLTAMFWVGRLAAFSGKQLDRGEQALRTVLAASGPDAGPTIPNLANIHFRLGEIAARRGNKDEAGREYRKTLELNPKFEPARKALKAL